MSEPAPVFLADLFDPRRRISLFYFRPLMLLFAVLVPLIYIGVPAMYIALVGHFFDYIPLAEETVKAASIGYLIGGSLLAYIVLATCLNRLRSAGLNLWLLLVPGYNLCLLFTASDKA